MQAKHSKAQAENSWVRQAHAPIVSPNTFSAQAVQLKHCVGVHVDGSPSCIGVAIRDYRGSLFAASSKILPAPFSVEITEALALQEGVLLALDLGISHAIVESDALSIIQAITEGDLGGDLGHIVQNIKDISSSFSWCSFQHLKRSGNRATHELARAARISGVSWVWEGVCPSFVEHIIIEDSGG
ncbi:hypothetical protein SO802_021374 [Lithocarpus litseifolius]|uniref:RNase H type-1 domain-containing protein n=1 Tax=Lithocarpus litseifolius TaxID=425828 RepID=A0AAW2CG54_9ROSI